MKIALIIPKNSTGTEKSFYDYRFFSKFLLSKKYFSYLLAIPTLASLTPPVHEVKVFDENIEDIDYGWPADLVGISVRTMFAKRAYEISGKFREKGVKTVLGGIHPSMCPDEALEHADAVVVGEAEGVWKDVLEDAEKGALKRRYESGKKTDLKASPPPERSVLSREKYFSDVVQTTKGCPFQCEFCSVYAFDGKTIRSKTVEQLVSEVSALNKDAGYKRKSIFFADDNIIADRNFARSLFRALKPLNLNWSCQASINLAQDEEMLTLMKDAGCGAVLIGFESVSPKNLSQMDKKVNMRLDYMEAIKKIQSHGILVHGSFIVGYDFDTEESFDELAKFIEDSRLLMPLVNILTPFPGTELFKRFEKEGRITHKDWSKYDAKTVVFRPARLSPEALKEGYRRVIRKIYSFDSIYRKLDHYWAKDFWRRSNEIDPIKFKYRLLFALRLSSMLFSANLPRSLFILKLLPRLFDSRVRVSTILTLMAYNDYAWGRG
ncbi:MAG: B12-binding domain-containing radical SAM protein [Deltaproteobacteria bacterium]|nr:B12-binding domain-containing radical SAM protein [Deltaproteobacteria bacterium]